MHIINEEKEWFRCANTMKLTTNLKGQRILVTAASQGIGFGVAKAFLEEGARVFINSSNKERLQKAKTRLGNFGEVYGVTDLSVKADIERIVSNAVEHLGGIDTLASRDWFSCTWHGDGEGL